MHPLSRQFADYCEGHFDLEHQVNYHYQFMLAGDPNRVKPDVHIHHCIVDACGRDVSNEECQTLFTEAVELLKPKHEGLTVAALDNTIWRFYSKASI